MLNQVVLHGRLTADPEIRKAGEKKICSFRLAVNDRNDHTDFLNCTMFGERVKLAEYLGKGKEVVVSGKIHTGSYENKDGNTVYTTEIYVSNIDFVGKKDQ